MMKDVGLGKTIKILTFSVIASTIFFAFSINSYAANLSDIEYHWAKEYINFMESKGAISGYPDGTFKPQNTVTVGEAIKLIIATFDKNVQNANGHHWANNYLIAAQNTGIIKSGMFNEDCLNDNISRKEIIYIVEQSLSKLAYKPIINHPTYVIPLGDVTMNDSDEYANYYNAMKNCYLLGIVQGDDEGLMNPDDNITRAEMVTILSRAYSEEWRKYPIEDKTNVVFPSNAGSFNKIWSFMPSNFYEAGKDSWATYYVDPVIYLNPLERIVINSEMLKVQLMSEMTMNAILNVSYDMTDEEWDLWTSRILNTNLSMNDIYYYKEFIKKNKITLRGGTVFNPCTIGKSIEDTETGNIILGIKGIVNAEVISNPNKLEKITIIDYLSNTTVPLTEAKYMIMPLYTTGLDTGFTVLSKLICKLDCAKAEEE